jgi:hypothetical protein
MSGSTISRARLRTLAALGRSSLHPGTYDLVEPLI